MQGSVARVLALVWLASVAAIVPQSHLGPRLASSTVTSMNMARQRSERMHEPAVVAAVIGGGENVVTGTLTLGVLNGIQIFTYILYARFALSWFPQIPRQFPVLRPINTVTEPYLRVFRQVIPPIGGFDLSALPAIFLLDILSQTAAAIGDTLPENAKKRLSVWTTDKQRALDARLKAAGLDYNGRSVNSKGKKMFGTPAY